MNAPYRFCCPVCRGPLDQGEDRYDCPACARSYPVVLGIPDFRVFPDPYIGLEDDRAKGRRLAEAGAGLDFAALVRYYWSITPDATPAQAERFTGRVLAQERQWSDRMPAFRESVERARGAPARRVLEVGCGTGGFLVAAARAGLQPVGVDIALRWLVIARKRLDEAGLDVPLVCACAEHLPFEDGTFELVASEAALEHVADPPRALAEARRVVSADGAGYFATTNRFTVGREPHVGLWGVGFLPRRWMAGYVRAVGGKEYRLIRSPSPFELRRMVRAAGFRPGRPQAPPAPRRDAGHYSRAERTLIGAYDLLRRLPAVRGALALVGPNVELFARAEGGGGKRSVGLEASEPKRVGENEHAGEPHRAGREDRR